MPSLTSRRLILAVALALTVVVPSVAQAHAGSFPRIDEIRLDPSNPERILARSDFWGLLISDDGGTSWRLVCAGVYGRNYQSERSRFAISADGTVFVAGAFDGLVASRGDLCDWAQVPETTDEVVQDVAARDGGTVLNALTATGGVEGIDVGVWESLDSGASWARTAASFDPAFVASSVGVAPSDGSRLYVVGSRSGSAGEALIYRSDDGGDSFTELAPLAVGEQGRLRVAAIHPGDPQMVFLRFDAGTANDDQTPDVLWMSTDGGATWLQAFSGSGDLPGLAVSFDGVTVLVAGPADGIWRADVRAAGTEGMSAFSQVRTDKTWALAWSADGLFLGGDDFAVNEAGRFLLGLSPDSGVSAEPLLRVDDIHPPACGETTTTGASCDGVVEDLRRDFVIASGGAASAGSGGSATTGSGGAGNAAADGGGATGDGNASPAPSSDDVAITGYRRNGNGCSCRVDPRAAGPRSALLAVILAFAVFRIVKPARWTSSIRPK